MLTGRVNWVMGVLGAALPLMHRLLPLLRYVPLLRNLYQRFQSQSGQGGAGRGQTSSVQSRYLRMLLNLDSGEMDGEILAGRLQGSKLSELPMEQLIALFGEFADDGDSQALLQTYLDRIHPNWREQAQVGGGADYAGNANGSGLGSGGAGQMSQQEACEILGLAPDADKQQIIAAHRRLMQKMHPDRGGSSYLAAKINKAKDVLLKSGK